MRQKASTITPMTNDGANDARLSLRVDFDGDTRLGPGKIRLLELVGETGSISAAGRAMGMSYRRAWLLIDTLNRYFRRPVVVAQHGGKRGGGATLTAFGADLVKRYRQMETVAARSLRMHLRALAAERPGGPGAGRG